MEPLSWILLACLLLTCQVTVLGNRLSGQVGVQQCDRILKDAFPEKMYPWLHSYRTIPSIGSQPEYVEFTTKRRQKFCVNQQKARLMKEYVDSQSRGSTETPTWTLLDRQPVTATSDQTPAVKLPVVETSEGIPHAHSSVPLTSPSLASRCNHSEEGCLEKRAFSVEMMHVILIFVVIIFLSLLSFAIYKCCKKSTSKGFNYHPTQTSSDEMGVPRWTQPA
ncbi:uncharacterized protein LOC132397001 isoform X3 [Hypanus sabinus]|uniref:uncharacterized protein LOC132397001 isoform X3 n=1 Tax=Hypanus sabinus TaxID=79690 RepID=UPI0028C4695B|nr:uncharacterized protein LOC132397001 isoform X3 [Hypanus sabinus]